MKSSIINRSVNRILSSSASSSSNVRAFSSRGDNSNRNSNDLTNIRIVFDASDPKLGGTDDNPIYARFYDEFNVLRYKNFPLNGNVTSVEQYLNLALPRRQTFSSTDMLAESAEDNNGKLQMENFRQFALRCRFNGCSKLSRLEAVDCVAHACPNFIKKDFFDLFPGVEMRKNPLTVITLTQKSVNDMSGWSERVEAEREELMLNFIGAAEEICRNLQQAGHWADFIEPSSGRPYFGAFTNSTLFETDERYRRFGIRIEDLGCCKVISHFKFGTHAFVGSVFTSAEIDSEVVKKIFALVPKEESRDVELVEVDESSGKETSVANENATATASQS